MWDKARRILYRGGEILELLMAAAVVAGILVAMITLVPELARYWEHRTIAGAFMEYLDAVFNVVIGIEFLKMLCKPSSANIIEVLIFLIARHDCPDDHAARGSALGGQHRYPVLLPAFYADDQTG